MGCNVFETPFELHRRIADSQVGADKVTVTVLVEQLGSISKCLDAIALGGNVTAFNAEILGELADLTFHLGRFADQRTEGKGLSWLEIIGEERYRERRNVV